MKKEERRRKKEREGKEGRGRGRRGRVRVKGKERGSRREKGSRSETERESCKLRLLPPVLAVWKYFFVLKPRRIHFPSINCFNFIGSTVQGLKELCLVRHEYHTKLQI